MANSRTIVEPGNEAERQAIQARREAAETKLAGPIARLRRLREQLAAQQAALRDLSDRRRDAQNLRGALEAQIHKAELRRQEPPPGVRRQLATVKGELDHLTPLLETRRAEVDALGQLVQHCDEWVDAQMLAAGVHRPIAHDVIDIRGAA